MGSKIMKSFIAGVIVAALSATAAFAHITLETAEAPVGSSYKAVLRVPHGCAGAPTNAVRLQIPEGVISAKPMPKAGWTLETVNGAYARSYDDHGTPITEGVQEVIWSGGNLPDGVHDEFVFSVYLTPDLAPGAMLYFPVIQQCGTASNAWIEVPADGQTEDDLQLPAPGLKLLPATAPGH
jgi:uncharacterized protein YcnI